MSGSRWLLLTPILLAAGCGSNGPERASISGTITLDGKPIKEGSITFIPTEGTPGGTTGWTITDGSYSVPKSHGPFVGKSKVELRTWRLTGKQIPNPMSPGSLMDEKVEAFPPQFNNETELVRDIQSGHNSLDFDLISTASTP